MIWRTFIIPHKNYRDPDKIKLIAKLPTVSVVEPIVITLPTAPKTEAVPVKCKIKYQLLSVGIYVGRFLEIV